MKFIILVAIVTSIYVCAMDVVSKYTDSLDFSKSTISVLNVSIKGEVNSPGSYYLPTGATLKDLVAYAGGFKEEADVSSLNAKELLQDGKTYYVPSFSEEVTIKQLSINKASISQLETIPGIGTTIAARIVAYRLENGPFEDIEQLCEIKGIKEATLEKIRPYITIE